MGTKEADAASHTHLNQYICRFSGSGCCSSAGALSFAPDLWGEHLGSCFGFCLCFGAFFCLCAVGATGISIFLEYSI